VNVASHDRLGNVGRFALLTLGSKNDVKVEWREIVEVSCIAGIKERSTERLRAAGIRTVQEFAGADISTLAKILSKPPPKPIEILKARALSLAGNRPILFRSLALPSPPELFLDIETDSQGGLKLVWLIGLCLGRNGPYKSFFAESPSDERNTLTRFSSFLADRPTGNILTFSASKLEERALRARLSAAGIDTSVCSRIFNLSAVFQQSVALPINSESVKDVGKFFGFRPRHAELDGLRVALDYEQRYLCLRNAAQRRKLKQRFLEYNEDDVRCLPFILDAVAKLSPILDVSIQVPTQPESK